MSRSATMALEQGFDEGIIHETVQDQECRESAQATEFAPRHPATPLTETSVAESIGNLTSFMPAIADQYLTKVQAATKALTDRVEASKTLSSGEITAAHEDFKAAMLEAARQLDTQRQWLADEIRSFDGLWQGKVIEKIKQTEDAVEGEELRIRSMTDDDAVDLSSVMRAITALNEKKAFLNGLKFQFPDNIK